MKQNALLREGNLPSPYRAPELTVLGITVEHGFAESNFDLSSEDTTQGFEDSGTEWDW